MKRLIQIELSKILPYSTFWVLSGIAFGFYLFFLFLGTQININFEEIDIYVYLRFPTVWQTIAYYSSWYNLLLALLIIILVGNEFNFKTFRQNVIDGLSRTELFISKLGIIVLFALIAFTLAFLAALIVGFMYTKEPSAVLVFSNIQYIFLYFIQAVGILSIAFFISVLLKNIAASIVIFIGVYIFELIARAFFAIASIGLGQYLPFNVFSNLCDAPSLNKMITNPLIKESLENSNQISFTSNPVAEMNSELNIVLALLYLVLFFYFSYRILTKRDL